ELQAVRSLLPQKHLIGLLAGGPLGGLEQLGCWSRQACRASHCATADAPLSGLSVRPAHPTGLESRTFTLWHTGETPVVAPAFSQARHVVAPVPAAPVVPAVPVVPAAPV